MGYKNILLLHAIKTKPIITIITSLGIFFIIPLIQSMSTALAFEIWFIDILNKPFNALLYIIYSILTGVYITLYIYTRNLCCNIDSSKYGKSGIIGSILGFIIGVCPACFSFVAFFLPLSISIVLTTLSPLLQILSISIIMFSIYKLGGFKRVESI